MNDLTQTQAWQDDPLWYRDAIIYQIHIKSFYDSNNDGIGDFKGLIEKLDYVQNLGVNTLWLLPFYPSPLKDDGYDIADYRNINPDYGARKDFRNFVREAHQRGLKVITELVINHTSDQHPWFQAARRALPGSSKRDFYVWSDTDKKFPETRIIFTDTETSNWGWDPVAKAYYWHRFFSHQPDLNHDNPQVVKAVIRVMRFWFDMGVDGMRLDAVPYLCVREGTDNENLPETHAVIRQIRKVVDEHYKNRMFLAEANQWPEDVREYFGTGDECHMAYHFPLMPRVFMAVALEDRHPITEIMNQTPDIPEICQWAIFLRNHDELTLEMVTDQERDYMYRMYSADPRMRINVGIRRRLAPLMDNDLDKVKLLNSLLMSMPGTPIIYYGDEIGMGDNIYLGDRNGVRTPMQWSPDRNAGFSKADPQKLYLPPVMDPIYGYEVVNVEAQSRNPSSLLNWIKHLIAVRKTTQAFGRGTCEFLRPGNRKILAYLRRHNSDILLCVANLSRSAQPVELDLSEFTGRVPVEMLGRTSFPAIGELPYLLTLAGHGFYWFLLKTEVEVPSWHEDRLPPLELPVLVLFKSQDSFFPDKLEGTQKSSGQNLRKQLEKPILTQFLPEQRWFAAKGETIEKIKIQFMEEWKSGPGKWILCLLQVDTPEKGAQTYLLPLSIAWDPGEEGLFRHLWIYTLSKVREHARMGILFDSFADETFCRELIQAMREKREVPFGPGRLKFRSSSHLQELSVEEIGQLEVRRPATQGSNTTVILGDRLFVKGCRHIQEGLSPEQEMGQFLTEVSPFKNVVPLAGALELETTPGNSVTLALVQSYVKNQGDLWSHTQDYLKRFLEDCLMNHRQDPPPPPEEWHQSYLFLMETLGRRTAGLHRALACKTGNRNFDPEPIRSQDSAAWVRKVLKEANQTFEKIRRRKKGFPEHIQENLKKLFAAKKNLVRRLESLKKQEFAAAKTRFHGDYHLGQVLLAENDVIIIDFEGEPARPARERKMKHSPVKDVAGMLRSFNYAAYSSLYEIIRERPHDLALLEPHIRIWQNLSSQTFLARYQEEMRDCPSYPTDPEHAKGLLNLFIIEKALYEIRYELDNRPAWVGIPLEGLVEILSTP
ncbi:MAG: maltose alpha-D-glucosyltransferase [Nitrospinae bacterium CG11_big_fil_rev_8_21_14_0_20_56_8]|nr:MAG: maltose alpha-D-glucosyltransferase [Nitrospinae bacterium CG11_big_fil_rev_8_21_14_0_20_56_8]